MKRVFIDGSSGTTGLRIAERLEANSEITLIKLNEADRKDASAKKSAINDSDITFFCLPDDAARADLSLCENPNTVIIDTSTAHRTNEAFAYGFAELSAFHKDRIASSKRIAVPGCHAGGFISLIYPLVAQRVLDSSAQLCCTSVTGYSGGGKTMIAGYEAQSPDPLLSAPRQYGLTQQHKHLKEMKAISGLEQYPAFLPIVADFYSGMEVSIPIFSSQLSAGYNAKAVKECLMEAYMDKKLVRFCENTDEAGFMSAKKLTGTDSMEISVYGNEERILLVSRFDNLGKGASGAAIQCMNIACGIEETSGLVLI